MARYKTYGGTRSYEKSDGANNLPRKHSRQSPTNSRAWMVPVSALSWHWTTPDGRTQRGILISEERSIGTWITSASVVAAVLWICQPYQTVLIGDGPSVNLQWRSSVNHHGLGKADPEWRVRVVEPSGEEKKAVWRCRDSPRKWEVQPCRLSWNCSGEYDSRDHEEVPDKPKHLQHYEDVDESQSFSNILPTGSVWLNSYRNEVRFQA